MTEACSEPSKALNRLSLFYQKVFQKFYNVMLTDQKFFQNLCKIWTLDKFSSEAFPEPLQQEDS